MIKINNLSKIYKTGDIEVKALDNISFTIDEGEFVVIVGASGAGKSTLLNILGGMDIPTDGEYSLDEIVASKFNNKELSMFRRKDIGFVFQFYNLLPSLTALENVALAESIASNPFDSKSILKKVGLEHRMHNFPSSLSGGEQQRVAIARALVKNPRLLLCDEPTGALDSVTGKSIISLLKTIAKENNKTLIMVTHNALFTKLADHVIKIQDGRIIEDYTNKTPLEVDEITW